MPLPLIGSEYAIRAGLNTTLSDSNESSSTNFKEDIDKIKDTVGQHVQVFAKTNTSGGSVTDIIKNNMDAITIALQGIVLAYEKISDHLERLKEKRKNFEVELEVGLASFSIPGNIEFKALHKEQQAVKGFIDLLMKYPTLYKYSGIKTLQSEEKSVKSAEYYALPLYSINQLIQPTASPRPLDGARISINLLFNSIAIQGMKKITDDFKTDSKPGAFFSSAIEGSNYLNDLRAPKFILTVLFNILWNIQYPVDCKTGFSLCLRDCLSLSSHFNECLNEYLGNKSNTGPFLINNNNNELHNLILHTELHVNFLSLGFYDEILRQFNLKDLTNSAHITLRNLDTNLFMLIYSKVDPVTKISNHDSLAAADIASRLSVLNAIMDKKPEYLKVFNEQKKKIPEYLLKNTFLNLEAQTIIDVMIIFCHLTEECRQELINKFRKNHHDEYSIFLSRELHKFNKYYIKPIEEINKTLILSYPAIEKIKENITKLTASVLLPLFTLVASDYRIQVDSNHSIINRDENGVSSYLSGKEQVQKINEEAQKNSLPKALIDSNLFDYHWSISPYLSMQNYGNDVIDSLPSKQYRLTQISELLDSISELTQNYKSFLQYKSFHRFLRECLEKISKEYERFSEDAQEVKITLSNECDIDRKLKAVLTNMVKELTENLDSFNKTIYEISRIVASPDFTELRKQELARLVKQIENKYIQIFDIEPINFINAYHTVLSKNDLISEQTTEQEYANRLYQSALEFLSKCKEELSKDKSKVPTTKPFYSKLNGKDILKYITLIDKTIDHINSIEVTLDKHEFFSQLELMGGRKKEDVNKSTFCTVILGELKKYCARSLLQRVKPPSQTLTGSHNSVPSVPSLISIHNQALSSGPTTNTPSSSLAQSPRSRSEGASHNDESIQVSSEESIDTDFLFYKNEFKKILIDYILENESPKSTNWILNWIQIFKQIFAELFNFIKIRLTETKVKVAKKIVPELENIIPTTAEVNSEKIILTNNELTSLSTGILGRKLLFFREHHYWEHLIAIQDEPTESKDTNNQEDYELIPDN